MRWMAVVLMATAMAALALVPALAPEGVSAGTHPGIEHNEVVVEDPTRGTPQVRDGKVWAIVEWGDLVIVGGEFSRVKLPGGVEVTRNNIFAFSKSTNQIDPSFAPVIDKSVRALAIDPDGRGVFVGGYFNNVNGESRTGLVFLDRSGDRIRGWSGRPNGVVADLAVLDRTLYVGGLFSRVSGVDRDVFASIDVGDGSTTTESTIQFSNARYTQYRGRLEVRRFEVSADGRRLIVLGNFQTVSGQTRDQVAVLDVAASPDRVAPWSTTFFDHPCNGATSIWPYFVRDVSISPDNTYFAVATVGGKDQTPPNPCDMAAQFDLADGLNQSPNWVSYSGGDSVTSVEITGEAVYVGGHFRWMNNPFGSNDAGPGAIPRKSLVALDPATGDVLAWDPGRQPRGHGVLVMETTEDGLWIGHDTDWVNDQFSPRLTHFSLPNPPPPTTTTTTIPGPTTTLPPTTTVPVAEQVVYETDFSGGNGWVTDPLGTDSATTGEWEAGAPQQTSAAVVLQRGDVTSGSAALVTGPIAGTGAGSDDVDNGVTSAWSPAFEIPGDAVSATLSFDWYFGHLDNAGGDDFFRVEIIDGGSATQVLSETGAAFNRAAAWSGSGVDISEFAGRSIRVRVSAADAGNPSLIEAGVDSVGVVAVVPTVPPTTTTTTVPPTTTTTTTTTTTVPPTTTTTTTVPPTTTTTTVPPTTTTTVPPTTTTTVPPLPLVDGAVVEITSAAFGGAYLSGSNGDAITTPTATAASRWTLSDAGNGRWYLRNGGDNTYLDGDADGIDTFFFQGSDRVWQFIEIAPGRYQVFNVRYGRLVEATGPTSPVEWNVGAAGVDDEWSVTRVG